MKVVDGMHAGQSWGGLHVDRCQSTPHVRSYDTDNTQSHHLPGVKLWFGSSRNWSVLQGKL